MKLEGTIETIPLRELVDMISYSSVTGALNLYAASRVGHLYFRDGHLYHCDFSETLGIEALARMFELDEATFSFVGDISCDQETLWGDMEYHVSTADRLAQRWRCIRSRISSLDLVPVLTLPFDVALRRVGPSHHQVLDRIDGQHTLKAIIEDLGWAEIDVAEVVAQMVQDNLVELRHELKPTLPAPQVNNQRGKLFDCLLQRSSESGRQPLTDSLRISEEMVLRALRG